MGKLQPERFIPILEGLRNLLLKHDFILNATFVAELIDLAHLESPDLVTRLKGGEVWGMGLADIAFEGNVEAPREQLHRDDSDYMRLLIHLAEEMKAQGIDSKGSEFIAMLFRKRLDG